MVYCQQSKTIVHFYAVTKRQIPGNHNKLGNKTNQQNIFCYYVVFYHYVKYLTQKDKIPPSSGLMTMTDIHLDWNIRHLVNYKIISNRFY